MLYDSKRLGGAHANLCISSIAIKILIRSPPEPKKRLRLHFGTAHCISERTGLE